MTVDRRRQVESLCLEALALEDEARVAFLDTACAGDAELRREVESLLAGQAGAAGFLERPAWQAPSTPLTPGTRLGPYEIDSAIGAGGMGEVYKARDTRLGRIVAIKVLPAGVASNPERRRRFEQEARAASALNHPHICVLFDIGDSVPTNPQLPTPNTLSSVSFLVMEHLDGQTLAARLTKGKLPVPQALDLGIQIADALSAAHKHGIVHRDLKPGNIMLVKGDGGTPLQVKLLDFGLAKLRPAPTMPERSAAPTVTAPGTTAGMVVGTVPYMAPEQIESKPTDARTDLFAFGTVLYEMLTGTRAFGGGGSAAVMAAILEREPRPLPDVAPLTPPALDRLIRRCLAKDPDARWDSAHDLADELRWIAQSPGTDLVPGVGATRARTLAAWLRRHPVWALAAGLILGASVVGALMSQRRPALQKPVTRSTMSLAPAEGLGGSGINLSYSAGGSRTAFAWTPDGQAVVFVGIRNKVRQLFVRRLDHDEAQPLDGTDRAQVPVVSADGRWVAFWTSSARAIQKMPISGGPVSAIAEGIVGAPRGMTWGPGGQLLYGANDCGPTTCGDEGRIWLIRGGGPPTPVTELRAGEVAHGLPQWLPGGQAFLYTVRSMYWTWGDEEVVVQSLTTHERKVILRNATDGRYVPTGHLVFMRMGTLFAVPYDLARQEVRGEPVALIPQVTQALTGLDSLELTGAGQYSVSLTGHLAYLQGPVIPYRDARVVSLDRHGNVSPLPTPVHSYGPWVRLSPNGHRLALGIFELSRYGLWLSDLSREGAPLTSVTFSGEFSAPEWMPDGRRVSLASLVRGVGQLVLQPVDGTESPNVLRNVPVVFEVATWTRDGTHLIAVLNGDIVDLDVDHPAKVLRPLVQTPAAEQAPSLSPDGHWLAYDSNRSGRPEVYVQPYPGPGPRVQVSVEGGLNPAWNPRGGELFFLAGPFGTRMRMMAAPVDFSVVPPRFGTPQQLFEFEFIHIRFYCNPVRCYDVAADGQRFFGTQVEPHPSTPPTTQINLVLNWLEEVKAKVPHK